MQLQALLTNLSAIGLSGGQTTPDQFAAIQKLLGK